MKYLFWRVLLLWALSKGQENSLQKSNIPWVNNRSPEHLLWHLWLFSIQKYKNSFSIKIYQRSLPAWQNKFRRKQFIFTWRTQQWNDFCHWMWRGASLRSLELNNGKFALNFFIWKSWQNKCACQSKCLNKNIFEEGCLTQRNEARHGLQQNKAKDQ